MPTTTETRFVDALHEVLDELGADRTALIVSAGIEDFAFRARSPEMQRRHRLAGYIRMAVESLKDGKADDNCLVSWFLVKSMVDGFQSLASSYQTKAQLADHRVFELRGKLAEAEAARDAMKEVFSQVRDTLQPRYHPELPAKIAAAVFDAIERHGLVKDRIEDAARLVLAKAMEPKPAHPATPLTRPRRVQVDGRALVVERRRQHADGAADQQNPSDPDRRT
jgi:hypothetical protein